MNPERWLQIDQLFHAALEREPPDRAQFLAINCASDEDLRHEVESLLAAHNEAGTFIETPAGDIAAQFLSAQASTFESGQQIENYRILGPLGSGGMGEVYLADDLRLNRKVALKLLPPHFMVNPDRVRRFEREARAASALNHPNIVTIFEIGQSNSTHFIATEFVDGKTLRQLIDEKPLTLRETLSVAIQVASALSGAHAAGIIHRDIKPENIMVRADGYVKILDFGLAKLTELQLPGPESETPTLLQSNPGLVMGTVQYMSPEQARGRRVDGRTDTWSLGIVLYELLAGHVPFSGETPSHVMVSLMEDKLPELTGRSNVPPELDRIVRKALRKNRKERYQRAVELARDLKKLKEDLQLEARLKGFLEAVPGTKAATPKNESSEASASLARTMDGGIAHQTANAEYLAEKLSNSRRAWPLVLLGLIITAGLGFGLWKLGRRNRAPITPASAFKTKQLVRLTNTGRVSDAAISPDGKYVAYVAESGGKENIWLREVATPNEREIVAPADRQHYGGTFSRDGSYYYYIVRELNSSIGVLYRVSLPGGGSEKLIVDVDGPVSLSPDGKQIAFTRGSSTGERALILVNADGLDERKLASRTGFGGFSLNGVAWSPDGKSIVCGAAYTDTGGRYLKIVSVNVADGSVNPVGAHKWKFIGRIAWLQDGRGVIFTAIDSESGSGSTSQLWFLSYPNGEAQRITTDLQDYHGVTLTSDGSVLVSKQTQTISSVWVAPDNDSDRAKPILSQKEDDAFQTSYYYRTRFSWMPNGQILYTSLTNGRPGIWVMSSQGTGNRKLTGDFGDYGFPSVTPDGRYIVFTSNRTGFMNVWRMDSNGGNEIQLTKGEDESWAWCAPDNHWIVFHNGNQGRRTLWRVPIEGGNPERLTDYLTFGPVVSPDGKWISAYYRPATKASWQLAIIAFDGGSPVKTFDLPQSVVFQSLVRWTPNGRALAYIMNHEGRSNIWIQPVDGGPAKQLTDFKSDQIFWFDWSADGRQLGVSRGTVSSDVVLIRDLERSSTHTEQ